MGRYTGRSSRLFLMVIVSFLLFVFEMAIGYIGNSLSLTSDAFAVLSHMISMIIGLLGVRVSRIRWHKNSTFGFPRADVLGAFGNSVFATALMFSILIEAVKRYLSPQKTEAALYVLIAGVVGLFFNVINYVIFMDCCYCHPSVDQDTEIGSKVIGEKKNVIGSVPICTVTEWPNQVRRRNSAMDNFLSIPALGDPINTPKQPEEEVIKKKEKKSEALNIRGVLLHVMGDALGSVVVVVAASIFYVLPLDENTPCNWQCYIDPSLTVIMVIIILSSAFPLIKETAIILLQMVPKGVNMQILANKLSDVPGVSSIHEVHVWELVSGKNIATLHVKCHTSSDYQEASYRMREVFHEAGVHSVTIQPEYTDHKSPEILCSAPCISKACDPQLCCSQQEATLVQVGNGYKEKNGSITPSLKKAYKNSVEIPIEPIWAEDVVKKDKSKKDTLNETGNSRPYIHSTRF
ncbi:calcium/manganese antiporter SLC30A10 isoform X2 [Paroedura picta]|uniref:calcium/manganese antiporter SLC30A10 isoform X2 n=1 Tax=Paroedura picta TaxID=143630 RepID=UPI00405760BE